MNRGLSVSLAALLVALALVPLGESSDGVRLDADADVGASTAPEAHPSIAIHGDGGFTSRLSGVRGGDGTPASPYVISGWLLIQNGGAAIRLVDTTKHVLIEDVYVGGREAGPGASLDCRLDPRTCEIPVGIQLFNASNVTVRNVRILSGSIGVQVRESSAVRLHDVSIAAGDPRLARIGTGLMVFDSRDVHAVNLTVANAAEPLLLIGATDVVVTDSTFQGQGGPSSIADLHGVTLARVRVVDSTLLMSDAVDGFTLVDSHISGGAEGLADFGTATATPRRGVRVCGNTFSGLQGEGAVYLKNLADVVVDGNAFVGNTGAATVFGPGGLVFEGNRIENQTRFNVNLGVDAAEVHGNSFGKGSAVGSRVSGVGTNATLNWWGDASGPSGAWNGTGSRLLVDVPGVHFTPYLTSPPAFAPSCPHVDVGQPEAHAPFTFEAKGEARVFAHAKLKVGSVMVNRTVDETVPFGTGPILLP